MELQAARQIIDTLSQGVHPVTGEIMPEDSPYNAPPVIRALFTVSQALGVKPAQDAQPPRPPRPSRPNAGKPWAQEDDERLAKSFEAGCGLGTLANDLGRTQFAVESRLVKLGKLPMIPGMRVSPAA
ncbi:MAG: hypothetical protein ABIU58_10710 [Ramlibacter sp.]